MKLWFIDFPTLVLVIAGGLQLGLLGFFEWDAAAALFGSYTRTIYMIVGLSTVWQLCRQRFV